MRKLLLELLSFFLVAASCCSSGAREAADRRYEQLRATIVDDDDPDVPPSAACEGVPLVTYDDMKRGNHRGDLVAVDGLLLGSGTKTCTLRRCVDACDRDLPCCNWCTSDSLTLLLGGASAARIELRGPGLACSGYDCALQCKPFGNKPKRPYRFVGRYESGLNPNGYTWVRFRAERWCHAS